MLEKFQAVINWSQLEVLRNVSVVALVLICATGLFSYAHRQWMRKTKLVDLPVLNLQGRNYAEAENSYIANMVYWMRLGRERHRKTGYQLWTPEGYLIMLPDECVEDLKDVHDSFADNTSLAKGVIGDNFWVHLIIPEIPHGVRTMLTPRLASLMLDICDEVDYVMKRELPPCEEWTPINIHPKVLRMVSLISGRVFVGPELNRDEQWVQANIDFTLDLFGGGEQVKKLPYYLRTPAIKLGLLNKVNRVHSIERYAMRHLIPILKERMKQQPKEDSAKPRDMMQWMMEHGRESKPPLTLEFQAKTQLVLGMSAIHASSIATINLIYDLVARPEYMKPLREEVDQIWEETNGVLDKKAMSKLNKLDSFLKESQRLNPAAHITFDRQITNQKGFTLKNGLHLPNGSHYAVAASLIATDAQNWENPEEFDGFRFSKLREQEGQPHKYQFVTTNSSHSMAFSHGKHSCPGRFFAAVEIKMISAYLIRHYDLKAPKEWNGRPASLVFGHNWSPDPTLNILMKRRAW